MTLTNPEFQAEYKARPGLIPVELEADRNKARWLDLKGYHCYQGSFRRALAAYTAICAGGRRPSEPWQCESSLDFLTSADGAADCLSPTGFIFHAGRCGSTLLAKVIARSQQHMVFGEGGPHNQIWQVVSGASGTESGLFRNLLLHMGRRRLPSYRAHIVKFTSHNILRFETIRAAFPEVPALFIFRQPAHILASYHSTSPAWMGKDLGIAPIQHSAEAAVTDFFRAALNAGNNLACLDYADLTTETLPHILHFLDLHPSADDLELMQAEFTWDAKTNRKWSPRPAAPESDHPVSPELQVLYEELSARRLFKSQRSAADPRSQIR